MKYLLIILVVLTLSSCARVYVNPYRLGGELIEHAIKVVR